MPLVKCLIFNLILLNVGFDFKSEVKPVENYGAIKGRLYGIPSLIGEKTINTIYVHLIDQHSDVVETIVTKNETFEFQDVLEGSYQIYCAYSIDSLGSTYLDCARTIDVYSQKTSWIYSNYYQGGSILENIRWCVDHSPANDSSKAFLKIVLTKPFATQSDCNYFYFLKASWDITKAYVPDLETHQVISSGRTLMLDEGLYDLKIQCNCESTFNSEHIFQIALTSNDTATIAVNKFFRIQEETVYDLERIYPFRIFNHCQ